MDTSNKDDLHRLLTPIELAERLGMSMRFIKRHIADRRIPGMVKCGRVWRFDPRIIEKAILSGQLLLD